MQLTLVDFDAVAFYPFTETRSISNMYMVGGTIAELWKRYLPQAKLSFLCSKSLSSLYEEPLEGATIFVDSRIVPTADFARQVAKLEQGCALETNEGLVLGIHSSTTEANKLASKDNLNALTKTSTDIALDEVYVFLNSANDLFLKLADDFKQFDLSGFQQYSENKSGVFVSGSELYVHSKAIVQPAFYDTSSGPIIVDEGAEVAAGAMLKGPIYVGKHAVVKMGAKIYGPTVISKECRVGGEVSNCNIGAYSNKGHDGFIGNAVIGEWCNLGADTNCSNLKNNYSKVKQYHHVTQTVEQTEMQFCGVLMGDHSKTAINTQINTATVFGAFSNAVCSNFPPKHLPNFSWYTDSGLSKFELTKAYEMAEAMMKRRNVSLTDETKALWRFLAQ
jgi:UDP-N-acetylglucosamine diphosphorylase/glucosamine-1-phosphate N-acetyltransferase